MPPKLDSLFLSGFKSFDSEGQTIRFNDVTVLLGPNGAGKSSLTAFFSMLNFMLNGDLQIFVAKTGSATSLLHYGPKCTDTINFHINFNQIIQDEQRNTRYEVRLLHTTQDKLAFARERVCYNNLTLSRSKKYDLEMGGYESKLIDDTSQTSAVLCGFLKRIRFYHFHDTSDTAYIKGTPHIDDNHYLKSNAGNLASFLYAMKNSQDRKYYDRIVRHIRTIVPQFFDFELEPKRENPNFIRLMWRDVSGNDYLFGPDQLSDGSLRYMALTSLLLQPSQTLPNVIVLDEPELGLHPAAISDLGDMIKTAALNSQVIFATQSTQLIDQFDVSDITVLEWNKTACRTEVKKFSEEELSDWLDEYTMSELWEKNVLGGLP